MDLDGFFVRQRELGDDGVMMISVGDPVCEAAELFEMSDFLAYALTEPRRVKFLLDALHERQMAVLRSVLRRYDMTDVLFRICGPEYVTPPYLSPAYFETYSACYLRTICREIRDAGGIARIHCHGKAARVLDGFLTTDAEALDPLEPPPDGDLTLPDAFERAGGRFCLFGNIELRELEFAPPERIDALVKEAAEAARRYAEKHACGFVLMPTTSPINVPLSPVAERNYLQMFDSARRYGIY